MVELADTSPYLYIATAFFVLSAISSDLLFIRFSLSGGFLFLILASLSGHSINGNFDNVPLSDGTLDLTMFVNMVLFLLNSYICLRLIRDEQPRHVLEGDELALFRFFQSRCGCTQLQFQGILENGEFLELPADRDVPSCGSTLYLVLEGKVGCRSKFEGNRMSSEFIKRSGQFFDIKLFNLFSMPIGFDSLEFHAKTITPTKFFCWNVHGLIAMRNATSPSLVEYWEYMALRALTQTAIRHYLNSQDTLYDSLLIPEHQSWLDGAPSRDFWKEEKPVGNWEHVMRQWTMIRSSLLNIIPPRGVRQRPGTDSTNPKQAYLELLIKAADAQDRGDQATFHFLKQQQEDVERPAEIAQPPQTTTPPPPKGLFSTPTRRQPPKSLFSTPPKQRSETA